jgi:hypothetical protein
LLGQRRIDVGRASASVCNRGNELRPNDGSGKQIEYEGLNSPSPSIELDISSCMTGNEPAKLQDDLGTGKAPHKMKHISLRDLKQKRKKILPPFQSIVPKDFLHGN